MSKTDLLLVLLELVPLELEAGGRGVAEERGDQLLSSPHPTHADARRTLVWPDLGW